MCQPPMRLKHHGALTRREWNKTSPITRTNQIFDQHKKLKKCVTQLTNVCDVRSSLNDLKHHDDVI